MLREHRAVTGLPGYCFFRAMNHPKMLPLNMVFAVTHMCNSRCKTCNIWNIYNKAPERERKELTLDEYTRIFSTIGRPYWVTIEGGEPFLRKDINEIVVSLYRIARPGIVNIPSNGSLPEVIFLKIRDILARCKDLKLVLNLSLDHIGARNDDIRGMKNSFGLFKDTVRNLKMIKDENFTLGIHSVISKYNYKEFREIHDYIMKHFEPDSYIVENAQIRREFVNSDSSISAGRDNLIQILDFFISQLRQNRYRKLGRLVRAFRINYYSAFRRCLQTGAMPYKCYAGFSSCQVGPHGDVWACAVKDYAMGNLKENDYDFKRVWGGVEADRARMEIKARDCNCALANAFYTNMLMAPRSLIKAAVHIPGPEYT